MPSYDVELSDGRIITVEGASDQPPSLEDIAPILQSHDDKQQVLRQKLDEVRAERGDASFLEDLRLIGAASPTEKAKAALGTMQQAIGSTMTGLAQLGASTEFVD